MDLESEHLPGYTYVIRRKRFYSFGLELRVASDRYQAVRNVILSEQRGEDLGRQQPILDCQLKNDEV